MSTLQRIVRRPTRYLSISTFAVILAVLVLLPMAMLVYASLSTKAPALNSAGGSFTWSWYKNLFDRGYLSALNSSLVISISGTLLAVAIGSLLAWLAARTDVPGKGLVQAAGVIPLFVSSLVGALAWSYLASPRQGYINILLRPLGLDVVNVYSTFGIIFVFGLYYAPYSFLLVYSALSLMNPELEESAHTHGAPTFEVMRRITFPLVSPAVVGSALLTFALILENFPVPSLLGTPADINTLSTLIYRLMATAPPFANQAAATGVLLTVLLTVIVFTQRKFLGRREYTTVSGKGFRTRQIALGRWRWLGFGFTVSYIILAVVLPFLALVEMSLRKQPFVAGARDLFNLKELSFANISNTLHYGQFKTGITNSILVAVLVAVIGSALCFALAFFVARSRIRGKHLVQYMTMLPLAVPAIVFGMGILWAWFVVPLPLYGTLAILVLAYVARFIPQGFVSISSSIGQVHRDLEESAVVSGASVVRSSISITIPLIRSSIVATALLFMILSFRELSVALFLFTTKTSVLSIVIFNFWDGGDVSRAAAASLLHSILLTLVVVVARRWMGVKQSGAGQHR